MPLYLAGRGRWCDRAGALIMVDDERMPLEPGEDAEVLDGPLPHARLLSADRRIESDGDGRRRHHRRNAGLDQRPSDKAG